MLSWQLLILVPLIGFSAPIFLGTSFAGRRLDQLFDSGLLPDPLLTPQPVAVDAVDAVDLVRPV